MRTRIATRQASIPRTAAAMLLALLAIVGGQLWAADCGEADDEAAEDWFQIHRTGGKIEK